MKKLLSVLMTLVVGITIFVIFNIASSVALPTEKSALNSERSSSSNVSLLINTLNDSVKQLSNDGMNILNTINQVKSDLKNGEVAIDVIINNPLNASVKDVIGVKISYDVYILENFDIINMSATKGDAQFNSETNEVEWVLPKIATNETVTLSYKLKLKSNFNKNILNMRLKTNRQIKVSEWGNVIGTYPEDSQIDIQICSPTIKLISEEGALSLSKTVTGEGANKDKSFNFTVTLSDRNINGTYGDMTFTNGVANIVLKHGQTFTAKNLPSNITYRVVEVEANKNNYVTSSTGESGTITKGETAYVNFTNTYNNPVGNFSVTKVVNGNGADTNKSFRVTVTLSDKTINGTYGDIKFTNGVANITLKNGQVLRASNIPANIDYIIEEVDANTDGYVTVYDNGAGKRTTDRVTGTVIEGGNASITIYNTKENKNFMTITKQFDTTSNFDNDVQITYESFKNNGISLETYKKYVANKKLTLLASNGSTNTSLEVSTDKNGGFKIPSQYAKLYNNFKVIVEASEGNMSLTLNIDRVLPVIPNSISFHVKANDKTSNTNWEKDFVLNASESYMKSIVIDGEGSSLEDIKVTEVTDNKDWDFSYKVELNGNNISVIISNKAGKYNVSGNLVLVEKPSKKISIEKVWNINENYIDIYFTSEDRDNFEVNVNIVNKKDKVLETVKLDKTGHGVSTKKYSSNEEIFVVYPDGKKVKVNFDSDILPKEVKIKVLNDIYILSSSNNWKMVINKDFGSDVLVEEIGSVEGFTTVINKSKDKNDNYEVKVINTRLSSGSVSYNEPKKPIKNPDTGLSSYYVLGIIMIVVTGVGLVLYKKRTFFK